MKKILSLLIVLFAVTFAVQAQVQVVSPHPDLDVKVKRCAMAGGTVVIDLLITNYGAEEVFGFCGSFLDRTIAYDDEGNRYPNEEGSKINVWITGKQLSERMHLVSLPQDVPLKARLEINRVSPQASKLVLVKFGIASEGAMNLQLSNPVQIRNLEWAK